MYIYLLCIMYIYYVYIYYVLCIYIYIYYVLCMYIYIMYYVYIYILYILFYVYMGAFNGATEHVSCIVVKQRANHSSAGTASVKYIVASGFSTALQLTGSQMFPDSTSLELQIFSNTSSLTHLPSSTMTNKERQETKSAGIPLCFRDRHCSMSEMAPVAEVLMLHRLGVERPFFRQTKTLGISCTSWLSMPLSFKKVLLLEWISWVRLTSAKAWF